MDIGAYVQIDELESLMKLNGIEVPRLRGLRLMSKEKPTSRQRIDEMIINRLLFDIQYELPLSQRSLGRYLIQKDGEFVDVNWRRVHGKRRKQFRFLKKQAARQYTNQYAMFNKYCGQKDILYIHARIGGANWNYYGGPELEKQPWFIEKADDGFDCTYCDIYAKLEKYD